ncbi:MAG TPA: hypothetical protein VGM53_21970 [Streptosporangiaceae bacterium]
MWKYAGDLSQDAEGKLVFPAAAKLHVPGLYRFTISDGAAYVGQARRSLRRRFRQYRRSSGLPVGPDRLTTRRNAHTLRDALNEGKTVTVEIATGLASLDAAERAEIAALCAAGVPVLNRAHVPAWPVARAGHRPIPLLRGGPFCCAAASSPPACPAQAHTAYACGLAT